jgi:hypothetical protein
MVILNGLYPINTLDYEGHAAGGGPAKFVPNDTYTSEAKHFTVITGINGKQCGTDVVQACFRMFD